MCGLGMWMQVPIEDFGCPGAGSRGSCESPDLGARSQTRLFWKSSEFLTTEAAL